MSTEKFKIIFDAFVKSERAGFLSLFSQKIVIKNVHRSLKSNNIKIGEYGLLLSKPNGFWKHSLNVGGMLFDFFNSTYNREKAFWFPVPSLSSVLLSDNKSLYEQINKRKRFDLTDDGKGMYVRNKALFEIAVGDWSGLQNTYDHFMRVYDNYHNTLGDKEAFKSIFQGFLEQDKLVIEKGLNALETKKLRSRRQKHITIEKYISLLTTALAKLAWMHGMEVEIDSEYVPKELLPFQPLEEYTIPYKFLRDFYRAQGVDWRYDPIYPELQDWENDVENPDRKKDGFLGRLFS